MLEFSSFFSAHVIYSVVKHVASNPYTKYRPYPTPAQFAASQDLISRTITFLRRELHIWEGLDVAYAPPQGMNMAKTRAPYLDSSMIILTSTSTNVDEMSETVTPGPHSANNNNRHPPHNLGSRLQTPILNILLSS
jgi:hypothetical protein